MNKKWRKIILVLIGAGCLLASQAQIKPGIKMGLGFSNQKRIDHADYYEFSTKAKTRFHIGVFAEKLIAPRIYIQPGIFFAGKGAAHTSSYSGTESQYELSYLELPLNVVYKYPLSFGKVYGGAGAVPALATSGTIEQNGKSKKMFKEGEHWKRGDLGLNILGGIELNNGFTAGISINTGLIDIYTHDAARIKNRMISLSVGYLWSRSR
jgi:hypothetical protein